MPSAMLSPEQIRTALLTEHFRYTPLTLLDEIINTANEIVYQAVNGIEDSLLNTDTEVLGFTKDASLSDSENDARARTEIEAGIVQLESLLNSTIDKNFDKLEIYTLRNLLTVSNLKEDEGLENWIRLDHYKELEAGSAAAAAENEAGAGGVGKGESALDALHALQRRADETDKLHRALKAEVARNEALLARLRPLGLDAGHTQDGSRLSSGSGILDTSFTSAASGTAAGTEEQQQQRQQQPSFSLLSNGGAVAQSNGGAGAGPQHRHQQQQQPLTQNTRFMLSQLPALKKILDELRPHLASVPRPGAGSDAQQTREAYIEAQARKAMARRGIDADRQGGDDARGDGEHRAATAEEVKALEGIADALVGTQR